MLVSVQREGEVKRRDKRPERVHSTGAAGVGRCRSPRTQTVLGRGYRADLRRLGVGGTGGEQGLEHYLHASADIEEGGGGVHVHCTDSFRPVLPHRGPRARRRTTPRYLYLLTLLFLLFFRNFLIDNI